MKLAVVSHSLVAERQFWFFEWLADHKRIDVVNIAPRRWGRYERSWGYPTVNEGDMVRYEFQEDAFRALEDFRPDMIYVQQEAYCRVSAQFLRFARRAGAKFALFVWDNIRGYNDDPFARSVLRDSDLVVCGNAAAEKLVKPVNENTLRCIQVGVNTDVFSPAPQGPEYDVIFQGRMADEKGYKVLESAAKGRFSVRWPEPDHPSLYADLALRYGQAKVLAAPSIDTPRWKEQHAGYASLEALSCGLYVATSNSHDIVESLFGCPGHSVSPQGDPEALRTSIERCLKWYKDGGRNVSGREWVAENYGYEAVANKLVPALEALL